MKRINVWCFYAFIFTAMITFNSCKRVIWASFTTPKDNIEYVPKILEQYLSSPTTNKIKIFQYDRDKYMGLFIYTKAGIDKIKESDKANDLNIMLPPETKTPANKNNLEQATLISDYQFIKYTPTVGEDEIVTATFLMKAVNELKKNKKIEVYSQTHPNFTRQFFILNK